MTARVNGRAGWDGALRFAQANAVEILLVAVGVFLRIRLATRFNYGWSYDWESHLENMRYVADHRALPPFAFTVTAYHPPLFYVVGGWVLRHGGRAPHVQALCVAAGVARMLAIAFGFHRYLPGDRFARRVALFIAAVLPSSLHLDVMLTNEAFSAAFSVLALLCFPPLFANPPRRRALPAVAFGVAVTLALLTKISGLVLLGALGAGTAAELYRRAGTARERVLRALPMALAAAVSLGAVAPVYARHHAETHAWLPSGYDSPLVSPGYSPKALDAATPYLNRRTLGYVFGLGYGDLLQKPFWPTLGEDHPRFWPVVVASTFGDYWNYRFAGAPQSGEPSTPTARFDLRDSSLPWERRAVAAGFVITAITVVGLLACLRGAWRRDRFGELALLTAPVLAVAGLLHFAITFPWDETGLLKAHYLQFAAAPLSAVFGVALSWSWRRWVTRPIAVAGLTATALVAAYTWHALRCWPFS